MASDEPSGPRPAAPIVLRIKLRYDDVEVMVLRFAANVGKSGLFLPTRSLQPIGAEVKFELRLADDTPALVGLGRVKAATPPDPQNPRATFGIAVELMRVTPQSRALILRMLERRRATGLPELGLPTAADIDAARRADAVEPAGRELDSGPVRSALPGASAASAAPGESVSAGEARGRAAAGSAAASAAGAPVASAGTAPVEPEAAGVQAPASSAAGLPVMASAPAADAAAGELLLTSPRRTTGAMAVAKVVAIAPLPPEPARRRRMPVGELIERASGPVAGPAIPVPGLAGLDAEVDVAATIARARALAGGPADAELEALCESISVPLEISVDAASAELARQLGGTPVRRDRGAAWATPPATAAVTGPAGSAVGAGASSAASAEAVVPDAPAEQVERAALAEAAAGAASAEAAAGAASAEAAEAGAQDDEAERGALAEAAAAEAAAGAAQVEAVEAEAPAEQAERGALADAAEAAASSEHVESAAAAQLADRASRAAVQADEDAAADASVRAAVSAQARDAGDAAVAADVRGDAEVAGAHAEHAYQAAAAADAERAYHADSAADAADPAYPAGPDGGDAEHADPVAAADGEDHAYAAEADERADLAMPAGPALPRELASSLAPLTLAQADLALELPDDAPARDRFSELDSDEHTEMGGMPVAGGFELPGEVDQVPALAALAEPVDGADEFEDFEILAEADAEDEDLLAAHGEHDASSRRALDGNLAPEGRRPSELDFAGRLDLGDESDLYYAAPSDEFATHHVPDHITDDVIASLHDELTGEHAAIDDRQSDGRALSSAGAALAAFETADEPLDDDAGSGAARGPAPRPAGVRPIFEPEPSGTFTLAGIPADSIEVDAPPPRNLAHGAPGRAARPEPASAQPEPAALRGAPPSLHEAPMDEDELEHALEALDVDLDDLAIPHAADRARDPSRPAVARPAPAVIRPAPAAVRAAPSAARPAPRAVRPAPGAVRPAPGVVRPAPRGLFPPSRGAATAPLRPGRSIAPLAAGPGRALPPRAPSEGSVDIEIDDDDER